MLASAMSGHTEATHDSANKAIDTNKVGATAAATDSAKKLTDFATSTSPGAANDTSFAAFEKQHPLLSLFANAPVREGNFFVVPKVVE